MVQKDVTVTNETGFHTRPGNRFVKEAQTFQSDIVLIKDGKSSNAKSLLSILKAGIVKNDIVTLKATGPDEQKAVDALSEFIGELQD